MSSFIVVSADNKDLPAYFIAGVKSRTNGSLATHHATGLSQVADNTADQVLSYTDVSGRHGQDLVFELVRILKPGGTVTITEPLAGRTRQHSEQLSAALTLAGFTNTTITPNSNNVEFSASKPNVNFNTTQTISIKKKAPVDPSVWTTGSTTDLVDEKDLIGEEDLKKPVQSDCEITSTKKACKNCTCGRAEQDSSSTPKQKLTLEMLENPAVNSSCGNCALGDAFRCGGCAYRGLPAFKPGEKITLDDDFVLDS